VAAGIPIVVCTPARLLEEVFDYSTGSWRTHPCPLAATALRTVVIDEADMLLSGGFARPLKQLVQLLDRAERAARTAEQQFATPEEAADAEAEAAPSAPPPPSRSSSSPSRQFIFAAATVHSSGRCTPGETLRAGFPDAVWVEGPQLHRCLPHVTQAWARLPDGCTPDQLAEEVLAALGDPAAGQAMVFANTTETVLLLAAAMQARGMPSVRAFCADMTLAERRSTVDAFRSGEARVLVCTDAAARGLDVAAVSHVVQANFALSAVDFLHRVGRTARAGAPGRVTSLFDGQAAALVAAVRAAVDQGQRVEDAFSRKRSFSKKLKKYGESRRGPVDLARAAEKRLGPPGQRAPPIFT
jgi:superfamily II DNA/RNA helicase